MFCLGQKIRSYIAWICCLISDYKDFTWSCYRINAYMPVYSTLCKCNINISRSYNFVNLRDTLRSISKCSDRLCAADFIYNISTCFMCCNQCCRCDFSVFSRRCYHYDFVNSCSFRWCDIHKDRRRISSFSAWYIDADSLKRCNFLSKHCSIRFALKPAVLTLSLVIITDIK